MKQYTVGTILQDSQIERQIELEVEAIENGAHRYRRLVEQAVKRGDGGSLKPAERLIVHWFEALRMQIKEEQRQVSRGRAAVGRAIYGPVLWCIDADRAAVITAHEMLSRTMAEPQGPLLVQLAYQVGNAIVAEIHSDELRKNHRAEFDELDRRFKRVTCGRMNTWAKKTLMDPIWSRKVCVHLGTAMINMLMGVATVAGYEDDWVPAFEHQYNWRDGHKKGCINMTDRCRELIEQGHEFRQTLRPRYLPMLVAPYAWGAEGQEGGYVKIRTPFISKPTREHSTALGEANLDTMFEALNAINSTPWQVNRRILSLVERLWKEGGGALGVPSADLKPMPEKPADIGTNKQALKEWKADAHEIHSDNAKLKGARAEFATKLDLAKRMAGEDAFWLPHQHCFRARVYPIPLFNHHGDDVSRGLMQFARAVPPSERGMYWIHVQAANAWGYDKADFDGRVKFIQGMLAQLREVHLDPYAHLDFLEQAEDPLQFLAAVHALFDPEAAARLPVQRDGCQNGIQHYAAAGRDEHAAHLVNITPNQTPEDAYGEVTGVCVDRITDDARKGDPIAKLVLPHVVRPVVKTPCMTTVYNVTAVGARNQVREKLKKRGVHRDHLYQSSDYLSKQILQGVGDTFKSAREIMTWIEQSVRMMCKHNPGRTVRWTSPLGMPVIQPYRSMKKVQIKTVMQRLTVGTLDETSPVSLAKQVQGGPPNWVHTLDGGHNGGTAIACHDENIDYASVHDSYWAHAENIDRLDFHLRDQFVILHSNDVVGNLHQEWVDAYPGLELPEPPAKGNLDVSVVMDSPYFFN